MRGIIHLFLASGIALGPGQVMAQTDYLAFNEYATEVARTINSVTSCKGVGFTVQDGSNVPDEISAKAIRTGIMMGVDRSTAESIVLGSLKRDAADMEYLITVPEHVDTTEALVAHTRQMFAFWDDRCRQVAASAFGSDYVQVSGNEETVQREMIQKIMREIGASD